jgi:serine/threonine protein kinase
MAIHGTPAFMASEQALGSADVDGRADIYATGCVPYWLLTRAAGVHGRHADDAPAPSCANAGDSDVGQDGSAYPFGS